MAKYYSTKTYGTDRGLSCCFRQWRATHSHCSTLHGYSIGIKLIFESETLDDRNWVFDFGGLKHFKDWAETMFDHTLVIAADDPHLEFFVKMSKIENTENTTLIYESPDGGKTVKSRPFGTLANKPHERGALCDLRIVDGVGCEMFAKMCYDAMASLLESYKIVGGRYPIGQTVRLKSAEVFEHAGNSAIYEG
jgi:6-pyruvoyltetrahydropterin/6-carboxytetrahydropterin synthase